MAPSQRSKEVALGLRIFYARSGTRSIGKSVGCLCREGAGGCTQDEPFCGVEDAA